MIVEPDFVDHWKTRLLVGLLGDDELAPIYLIRLWAHCQQRKSSSFESLPTAALKAICRFNGAPEAFEQALIDSGFVARDGAALRVVGWDEYNASLIANWTNGGKGGRPKKAPIQHKTETHGLSMGSPSITHGVSDREEKIREEKKEHPQTPQAGPEPKSSRAISLSRYLEECKAKAAKPIPEDDSVFDYASKVGVSTDFLRLQWLEFKDRYGMDGAKRYKSWPAVFGKSVRGNWFKLWYITGDGGYALTTVGQQAKRQHGEGQ